MLSSSYFTATAQRFRRCPHHSLTRRGLAIVSGAMLACNLLAIPICAAAEAKPSSSTTQRETLTIETEEAKKPWTGDLDGIIERGFIRILTVYSKTFYSVDKGVARGAAIDAGRTFVEDLNKKLAKEKKLKGKHLKVRALFIPVGRGELLTLRFLGGRLYLGCAIDRSGEKGASERCTGHEGQPGVD